MKRRMLVAVVCCLSLVGLLQAQGGGGGRGQGGGQGRGQGMGGGSTMTLVADAKIQEELKISKETAEKIKEINTKMSEKRREIMTGSKDFAEVTKVGQEAEKAVNELLNDEQKKRLKQLSLQSTKKTAGFAGLMRNKDVTDALKLTSEQNDSLKSLQDDMAKMMQEMRGGGGGAASKEGREKMQEFTKSMNAKIEKMLTDDQKKALEGLMGAEYKGEFPSPFGNMRRKDG